MAYDNVRWEAGGLSKANGGRSHEATFRPAQDQVLRGAKRDDKHSEHRLCRPRWNEKTCPPGRPILLSKGYGKQHSLQGVITEFLKRDAKTFGSTYRDSMLRLYGKLDKPTAEIRIKLECD
jgi:hypothetical protein